MRIGVSRVEEEAVQDEENRFNGEDVRFGAIRFWDHGGQLTARDDGENVRGGCSVRASGDTGYGGCSVGQSRQAVTRRNDNDK